jgi:hypothetical protein
MRGLGVGPLVNRAPWLTLAVAFAGSVGCKQVDDRPAEWAYISPAIFQPNCATTSCHGPAAAVSGLDFSTPENGYASLTKLWVWVVFAPDAATPSGRPCGIANGTRVCEEQERPLVTPYDPAGSRVVNMLRARDAPRMPPDRPLPEADIELVERWILNGAFEYPQGPAGADAARIGDAGRVADAGRSDAGRSDAADARYSDAAASTDGKRRDGSNAALSDAALDRRSD